jgi:hypothetical protein
MGKNSLRCPFRLPLRLRIIRPDKTAKKNRAGDAGRRSGKHSANPDHTPYVPGVNEFLINAG